MILLTAILLSTHQMASLSGTIYLSSGKPAKEAVVYLNGKEKSKPLKNFTIDQRDKMFMPHVSVITIGTRVKFPNDDMVFHNVFTEYHSERFDLGMYARGQSKSQLFDRPGLAVLLCSIHPQMSAYVMCVDTPYYTKTDAKGHYSIKDVQPGDYDVCAWHESSETSQVKDFVSGQDHLDLKMKRK